MSKANGYLRLIRPVNCLMMGFAVIVGAAIANPNALSVSWPNLTLGFLTGFMLTAASMSINDYYDKAIDAVNEPNRPIPSGLIKPRVALVFAFALTAIGFAASLGNAYLTTIACFVIALIAWAVFVTYTTVGKRSGLPGNLLVSTCVAIPFVYGNYAVASTVRFNVLIFVAIAFLANTGREVTKGIADVRGDELQDVKTLAVRFGEKGAAVAAALFYVFAVSLTPIPWLMRLVSVWFVPLVAITDLGLLASSFMLLRDYSRESARKIKRTVLLWLLIGLLAFIVGAAG